MELDEAKQKLVQAWGALGTSWGVNRTMAQVHALLLISSEPLSAEDIMSQLEISRGNANMNIRALIDWRLARREYKTGERREYFVAEKDMWQVALQIIRERQKRELEPILQTLKDVQKVEEGGDEEERKKFIESVQNLDNIVGMADNFIDFVLKSEQNWFTGNLMKLLASRFEEKKDA